MTTNQPKGGCEMKQLKKCIALISVFLLSLVVISIPAIATMHETSNYRIEKVEVNGDTVLANTVTSVERGETLDVKVTILGTSNKTVDAVRVKAEIEGWEFEDIDDRTDFFTVRPGVKYVKTLKLNIPDDIDTEERFTLRVEAEDSDEQAEFTSIIDTATARHEVNINDVIFRSGETVRAGDSLLLDVVVENDGSRKEEDISVRVSIPELGINLREFIDQLITEKAEIDAERERDTDTEKVRFSVRIPNNAKSGDYDLNVEVNYNRGKSTVRSTETVTVSGVAPTTEPEAETIITLDSASKQVAAGEGVVYKLMFANLASQAQTFSVSVAGTENIGSSRVDPGFLTLQPGQSGDMFVFLTANEATPVGKYSFKATINSNGNPVKDVTLQVEVTGIQPSTPADFEDVRRGLEIGFVVLLIILVILGIIIAIGKLRGGDKLDEEPTSGEGQTYYYYPKY